MLRFDLGELLFFGRRLRICGLRCRPFREVHAVLPLLFGRHILVVHSSLSLMQHVLDVLDIGRSFSCWAAVN